MLLEEIVVGVGIGVVAVMSKVVTYRGRLRSSFSYAANIILSGNVPPTTASKLAMSNIFEIIEIATPVAGLVTPAMASKLVQGNIIEQGILISSFFCATIIFMSGDVPPKTASKITVGKYL